jgi:hypothetical protein
MSNIITGTQLRAARILAGLTSDWAEAQTCLRSFQRSRKACTGGHMNDSAGSIMPPKSDQPLA